MAKTPAKAPRPASAPQAKPAIVAPKTSTYKMLRSGVAEGVSGETYTFKAGDLVTATAGDLDHMIREDGTSRYCEKK